MLATIALTLHDYEKAEEFLIRVIDSLLRHGTAADDNIVVSANFHSLFPAIFNFKKFPG